MSFSGKKFLITGATGMIGRELVRELLLQGAEVIAVSRSKDSAGERLPYPVQFFEHDLGASKLPSSALDGVDGVIHLAGESIASGRWSESRKKQILESRTRGTENLAAAFTERASRGEPLPGVWVSASAIGFYGDRGEELLDESSSCGRGFLAEVTSAWETAFFKDHGWSGVRRSALRLGIVLSREGGVLARLLPLFRKGLGGPLAGGKPWMSWIHIEDVVRIFLEALRNKEFSGPFNAVAPEAVTNAAFTRALGKAAGKPAILAAPGFALRTVLGEMSELVLSSQRVIPLRLQERGFRWKYAGLSAALSAFDLTDDELFEEQWVPLAPEEVWTFFEDPENLEQITPDYLSFKVLYSSTKRVQRGTLIDYRLRLHGAIPLSWRTEIDTYDPPNEFVDNQLKGPYAKWRHRHRFLPMRGGTLLQDRVLYRIPMGLLGKAVAGWVVRRDVEGIFRYRKKIIAERFGKRSSGST